VSPAFTVKLLKVVVPVIVWLVPLKVTVPEPAVNVPELLQLPAILNAAEAVVKVPADMVKLVKVVAPLRVSVPAPALVKLYDEALSVPPRVRV
jgi:hypothetical protein